MSGLPKMVEMPKDKGRKGQCRCGHMKKDHFQWIDTDWMSRTDVVVGQCEKCDCSKYHQNRMCPHRHRHWQ